MYSCPAASSSLIKKPHRGFKYTGGEHEIRTRGSFHFATFPRWCLKPLGQLSKVQYYYNVFKSKKKTGSDIFRLSLLTKVKSRWSYGNIVLKYKGRTL